MKTKNELKQKLATSVLANALLFILLVIMFISAYDTKQYYRGEVHKVQAENEKLIYQWVWASGDSARCMSAIPRAESSLGIDLSAYFVDNPINKVNKDNRATSEIPNE